MRDSFSKFNWLYYLKKIIFVFNILFLIISIIFFIIDFSNHQKNMYGYLLGFFLLINIIITYKENLKIFFEYLYLSFIMLAIIVIIITNFYASADAMNFDSQSIVTFIILFSIIIISLIKSFLSLESDFHIKDNELGYLTAVENDNGNLNNLNNLKVISISSYIRHLNPVRSKKYYIKFPEEKPFFLFGKYLLVTIAVGILLLGIYLVFEMITIKSITILEIFISELSLFIAIFYLCLTLFLSKILAQKFIFINIVNMIGISIFLICLLPLFFIGNTISQTEKNFMSTFNYQSESVMKKKSVYKHREAKFSIYSYIFGIKTQKYKLIKNVKFYNERYQAKEDSNPYCDIYQPLESNKSRNNNFPVLVRINDGLNYFPVQILNKNNQIAKYFANKGYVVFDINLDLDNNIKNHNILKMHDDLLKNDFNNSDKIIKLGAFTKFLTRNAKKYQADVNSVFIYGAATSGNLAAITALGIKSAKYGQIFTANINVKGLIILYPSLVLPEKAVKIYKMKEFINPNLLVADDSPPCLLFQGDRDGIINKEIAIEFKNSYIKNKNPYCLLLNMPFGGHKCDIYFSGYYNQIFINYMDKFMKIYK